MSNRLLITGANGFVGSHLVEQAIQDGFNVYAAVRKNSNLTFLQGLEITLVYPDYFNKESLVGLLEQHQISHIAHVAGLTKGKTEQDYIDANTVLTENLALAAMAAKIDLQKFVFVSSLAVMGPSRENQPLTENSPTHPVTHYGKSKLQAEKTLQNIAGLPLVILRPTAVYGPRDKDMFILIKMIKKGWELYIGRINQLLTFIYVKDLCSAILSALTTKENNRAYLLSDGDIYNRYAFSDSVKSILKKKTFKMHLPKGLINGFVGLLEKINKKNAGALNKEKLKELTGSWECSIEKAEKDLNFKPQYKLHSGLEETINWDLKNNWL